MQLQITLEDLESGVPTDCSKCAVARSIKRHVGNRAGVHINWHCFDGKKVGTLSLNPYDGKGALEVTLPKIALGVIIDFDKGKHYSLRKRAPITFNLSAECFML